MLNQSLRLNCTRSAVVSFYLSVETNHSAHLKGLCRHEKKWQQQPFTKNGKGCLWRSLDKQNKAKTMSKQLHCGSWSQLFRRYVSVPVGLLSSQEPETFHPGTSQSEPEATVWKANWTLCYSLSRAVLSAHYLTPVPIKSRWLGFDFEPSSLNRSLWAPFVLSSSLGLL